MIAQSSPKHKQSPKKGTNSVQPFKTAFGAAVLGLGSLGVGMFGTHGVPTPFSPPKRKGHAPAPSHPKTNIPHLLLTPLLSRIFGTTCLDPFRIHRNHWLKFMFGRRRMRRGLFGDAPEAPRVSPKPYARSRTTRPPTVYRPASAIPLTGTCAASEVQRVARLRAASCATPASLPLRARLGRPQVLRGRTPLRSALRTGAAEARGRVVESFSGPTWPATRRFTSRGRCGSEGQRLRSPRKSHVGVSTEPTGEFCEAKWLQWCARKSSERAAPRAAAADKEPICHGPVRKSGIRVLLPTPCSFSKPGACPHAVSGACPHAVSFRFVSCGDSVPLVEAILFRLHGGQ